jgi:hypothetical protein
MSLGLLVGQCKKQILGPFLVLIFLAAMGCAWADETMPPLQSSPALRSPAIPSAASVSVLAGPLETERMALLTKIQEARVKGIGIRPYMAAFLDLEGMVEKGASPESIRTKLASLNAALNKQLYPFLSTSVHSDIGIIGLKFKVTYPEFAEIETVFPDSPAAKVQLKAQDIITHVDGCPTKGLTKEEVYRMITGSPGTKVNITIRRGDATFNKTLTRMSPKDFAKAQPAIWKMYEEAM